MTVSLIKNWDELEAYTSSLYSSLGYLVRRNTYIGGQQIDVLAERHLEGVGVTRIIIECKFKNEGSVGNDDVFQTINSFNAILNSNAISHCVIVTNASFSTHAQNAALNYPLLKLVTINSLEDDLLNVNDSLLSIKKAYETDRIHYEFIPQSGVGRLPYEKGNRNINDTFSEIINWIDEYGEGFLAILADFGGGKTTLMRKIEHELCQKFLLSKSRRRPLLFNLKDYVFHSDLDDFIEQTIKNKYQRSINRNVFWNLAKDSGFVFLLDGFDEISSSVDRNKRAELFLSFYKIFTSGSPVILTCRAAYFVDNSEINSLIRHLNSRNSQRAPSVSEHLDNDLFSLEQTSLMMETNKILFDKYVDSNKINEMPDLSSSVISLSVFDESKIVSYLEKFDGEFIRKYNLSAREVKSQIEKIYDLTDLIKRPIMLSMIKDTVLNGQIDITNTSVIGGSYALYEAYTTINLKRDWGKGTSRRFLGLEQRRYFAELIAMAMFDSGSLEVSYEQILDISEKGYMNAPKLNQSNLEEITADIQVTTFLTRKNEKFRFSHKSFMEFFVARRMVSNIISMKSQSTKKSMAKGKIRTQIDRVLTREIIQFIGNACSGSDFLREEVTSILMNAKEKSKNIINNSFGIIMNSEKKIRNIRLMQRSISDINVNKVDLYEFYIINSVIDHSEFSIANLNKCAFLETALNSIKFRGGIWNDSRVLGTIFDCSFKELEINDCTIEAQFLRTTFEHCHFYQSTLKYQGEIYALKCTYINSNVLIHPSISSFLRIDGCEFNGCSFFEHHDPRGHALSISKSKFSNCKFNGITVNQDTVDRIQTNNNNNGYVENSINLNNCNGIIFLDDNNDKLPRWRKGYNKFGNVCIVHKKRILKPLIKNRIIGEIEKMESVWGSIFFSELKKIVPSLFLRSEKVDRTDDIDEEFTDEDTDDPDY